MKIGYLGMGSWGFCLANLLASKGYHVIGWSSRPDFASHLRTTGTHPAFPNFRSHQNLSFTSDLAEALEGIDLLAESVTSAGLRPVFTDINNLGAPTCPIVLTSKGIEQNSGLILAEVVTEIFGEERHKSVGLLSGPSFAQEVIHGLPASVVATAFAPETAATICGTFATNTFRVYPNSDIYGVSYGGALKNVIAIACGICHGLALGESSRAALMTRGLHEARKLAIAKGCRGETLNGLSGMGDFVLTCNSPQSRNFRFGMLLAEGLTSAAAETQIGMVIEGAYTCRSVLQLSSKMGIAMPVTEAVHKIIDGELTPLEAVRSLMLRAIKEEHL